MSAPSVASPKALSSSGDERFMGQQLGVEENSLPPTTSKTLQEPPMQFSPLISTKFSFTNADISEASLAEGFSWQPKQKLHPGQFSGRPLHSNAEAVPLPELSLVKKPFHAASTDASRGSQSKIPLTDQPDVPGNRLAIVPGFKTSPRLITNTLGETEQQVVREKGTTDLGTSPSTRHHGKNTTYTHSEDAVDLFQPRSDSFTNKSTVLPDVKQPVPSTTRAQTFYVREPRQQMIPSDLEHRQQSPASACGDLEGPIHQSPRQGRSIFAKNRTRSPGRSKLGCVLGEEEQPGWEQPPSRNSNISRKRSSFRRSRPHVPVERKKDAMLHVARSWNECMEIAAEETRQAREEIDSLSREVHDYKSKLLQSQTTARERTDSLQHAEARCAALDKQIFHVQVDNKQLKEETQALRDELSELKQSAAGFGERYGKIKAKLNETIAEHNSLYERSQQFYTTTKKEVEESKAADATRIALFEKLRETVESSKKAFQGKQVLLEARLAELEEDKKTKEQIIADLEGTIAIQNQNVSQERARADELLRRVEAHEDLKHAIQPLEDKLESLRDLCVVNDLRQHGHEKANEDLRNKLEFALSRVEPASGGLEQLVTAVQTDISAMQVSFQVTATVELPADTVSSILPAIQMVIGRQRDTQNSILGIATGLEQGLGELMSQLHSNAESSRDFQTDWRAFGQQIFDLCNTINGRLKGSQEAFVRIESFVTQADSDRRVHEVYELENTGLARQLEERQERIRTLEEQVLLVKEDYCGKIESLIAMVHKSDRGFQNHFQEIAADLSSRLEDGFRREKERSERTLVKSETMRATAENQLIEVQRKLEEFTANNTSIGQQRDRLDDASLLQKIQYFERAARDTDQLHQRHLSDSKAIDTLRSQLAIVSGQVPKFEDIQSKLDKIEHLNSCINSTASYLNTERQWVQRELQARQNPTSLPAPMPRAMKVTSPPVLEKLESGIACISIREDAARRRVVVSSPGGEKSPSPPPSIIQEQQRRRAGKTPRSILKFAGPSAVEARVTAGRLLATSQSHSQYNRPVIGAVSSTSGVSANTSDQVRSGLVSQPQLQSDLTALGSTLPTIAEFERINQASGGINLRRPLAEVNNKGRPVKRAKTEP